ncbi:MAG: hypothetical protein AAF654_11820 [Myxococcota bacterium]
MRIEDEGAKDASTKRMEIYQQLQERQHAEDLAKAAEKQADEATKATGAELSQQQDFAAQTLDAEVSGAELHAQAVDAASSQQDRGEQWMGFGDKDEGTMPPSVDELNAQEKQDATNEQDQRERISVQELQNQLTINSGAIRG